MEAYEKVGFSNHLCYLNSKAENFCSGTLSETKAQAFLQENNINLVVVPLHEVQFFAHSYPFLTVVYKNKDIEILSR